MLKSLSVSEAMVGTSYSQPRHCPDTLPNRIRQLFFHLLSCRWFVFFPDFRQMKQLAHLLLFVNPSCFEITNGTMLRTKQNEPKTKSEMLYRLLFSQISVNPFVFVSRNTQTRIITRPFMWCSGFSLDFEEASMVKFPNGWHWWGVV